MKKLDLNKIIEDNKNQNSLDSLVNQNGSLVKFMVAYTKFLVKNDFKIPMIPENYEKICKTFIEKAK